MLLCLPVTVTGGREEYVMRYANVTLLSGVTLREARVIGAGNGSERGMDLFIDHAEGRRWVNTEEVAEIVWDPCGSCHRPVVEDGQMIGDESWHVDCIAAHNPHV